MRFPYYSGIITVVIIYTFPDWYTFSRDKMQWDTIWSRVWMCTKNPKYIHPSLYTPTSIQSKNKKEIVFLREVEKIGVDVFLFILPHVYAYCLSLRVYVYQYSKSDWRKSLTCTTACCIIISATKVVNTHLTSFLILFSFFLFVAFYLLLLSCLLQTYNYHPSLCIVLC